MGLYFNHYMVVGVDILSKKKEVMREEEYLPYIEGHKDIEFDILNGAEGEDFLFFGKILANGDHWEGFESRKSTVDISSLKVLQEKIAKKYTEVFKEPCELSDVKLIACTSVS